MEVKLIQNVQMSLLRPVTNKDIKITNSDANLYNPNQKKGRKLTG